MEVCQRLKESPVRVLRSLRFFSSQELQKYLVMLGGAKPFTQEHMDSLKLNDRFLLPQDLAQIFCCFAFKKSNQHLYIATEDPLDPNLKAHLEFFTGDRCLFFAATPDQLSVALKRLYHLGLESVPVQTSLEPDGTHYSESETASGPPTVSLPQVDSSQGHSSTLAWDTGSYDRIQAEGNQNADWAKNLKGLQRLLEKALRGTEEIPAQQSAKIPPTPKPMAPAPKSTFTKPKPSAMAPISHPKPLESTTAVSNTAFEERKSSFLSESVLGQLQSDLVGDLEELVPDLFQEASAGPNAETMVETIVVTDAEASSNAPSEPYPTSQPIPWELIHKKLLLLKIKKGNADTQSNRCREIFASYHLNFVVDEQLGIQILTEKGETLSIPESIMKSILGLIQPDVGNNLKAS
jgi:hypothetical protein